MGEVAAVFGILRLIRALMKFMLEFLMIPDDCPLSDWSIICYL